MFKVVLPQTAPRCDPQHRCRNVGEVPRTNDGGFRRSLALFDDHRARHRLVHAIDAAFVLHDVRRPGALVDRDSACSDASGARSRRAGAAEQASGSVTGERTIWSDHAIASSAGHVPHDQRRPDRRERVPARIGKKAADAVPGMAVSAVQLEPGVRRDGDQAIRQPSRVAQDAGVNPGAGRPEEARRRRGSGRGLRASDASGRASRYRRPRSSRVSHTFGPLVNMSCTPRAISRAPARATPPATLSGSEPMTPANLAGSEASSVQLAATWRERGS